MRIIVASSNVFHRELSSFILHEAGYMVHEVSDGAKLLHDIEQIQPQIILLDMSLDGVNSLDMARQIRQRKSIPVILLTSGALSASVQRLYSYSDDLVIWPYQPEELLAHVHACLGDSPTFPSS